MIFEAVVVLTLILPAPTLLALAWIGKEPALLHRTLAENSFIIKFFPMVVAD